MEALNSFALRLVLPLVGVGCPVSRCGASLGRAGKGEGVVPYALRPTPYDDPTPYGLRPTAYALRPTPYGDFGRR
eukprot:66068-Chlamydomonas_euryale.AAC.7